jgi:hypothetical protein
MKKFEHFCLIFLVIGALLLGAGCSRPGWIRNAYEKLAFDFAGTIVHDTVSRTETQQRVIEEIIRRGDLDRAARWLPRVDNWRRVSLCLLLAEKWHEQGNAGMRDRYIREADRLLEKNPAWNHSILAPQVARTARLLNDPLLAKHGRTKNSFTEDEGKRFHVLEALDVVDETKAEEAAAAVLAVDDMGIYVNKVSKVEALLEIFDRMQGAGQTERAATLAQGPLEEYLKGQSQAELPLRSLVVHHLLDGGRRDLARPMIVRIEELTGSVAASDIVTRAATGAGMAVLYAKSGQPEKIRALVEKSVQSALADPHFMPYECNYVLLQSAEAWRLAGDRQEFAQTVGLALRKVEENGNLRVSCEMAADICLVLAKMPESDSREIEARLRTLLDTMKAKAAQRMAIR